MEMRCVSIYRSDDLRFTEHFSFSALLLACLEVDPARRITIPQIRTHPWMMSCVPSFIATSVLELKYILHNRPSQITTQMLPLELTKGLRQMGMWDVAEPTRSQIPQVLLLYSLSERCSCRSIGHIRHRGAQNDPYASQLTQMDSQFMQGTGMAVSGIFTIAFLSFDLIHVVYDRRAPLGAHLYITTRYRVSVSHWPLNRPFRWCWMSCVR